jgi:hypothetical protein
MGNWSNFEEFSEPRLHMNDFFAREFWRFVMVRTAAD